METGHPRPACQGVLPAEGQDICVGEAWANRGHHPSGLSPQHLSKVHPFFKQDNSKGEHSPGAKSVSGVRYNSIRISSFSS